MKENPPNDSRQTYTPR